MLVVIEATRNELANDDDDDDDVGSGGRDGGVGCVGESEVLTLFASSKDLFKRRDFLLLAYGMLLVALLLLPIDEVSNAGGIMLMVFIGLINSAAL